MPASCRCCLNFSVEMAFNRGRVGFLEKLVDENGSDIILSMLWRRWRCKERRQPRHLSWNISKTTTVLRSTTRRLNKFNSVFVISAGITDIFRRKTELNSFSCQVVLRRTVVVLLMNGRDLFSVPLQAYGNQYFL